MFDCDKIWFMKKIRNDSIIILLIVVVAACFFFFQRTKETDGIKAVVYQDGIETGTYFLHDAQTKTISYKEGGYNVLSIETDGVSVRDADCPDKLCVKHRKISKNGESIICLPHKLVIEIQGGDMAEMDAIAN